MKRPSARAVAIPRGMTVAEFVAMRKRERHNANRRRRRLTHPEVLILEAQRRARYNAKRSA